MRYLASILALGALVALHELGHLLTARLFGIHVTRFAIGFGPPIFSWKRKNIEWVLGAIPFGGYVQIRGMNPHEEPEELNAEGSFAKAAAWKRALVLVGGSAVNYFLGVAIMFALFVNGTHLPVPMTVGTVAPGTEAARAQLRPGDELLAINGEKIQSWGSVVERVNDAPNQPLTFTIRREGEREDVVLTPRPDEKGIGRIGVGQQYVYKQLSAGEAVGRAFAHVNTIVGEGLRVLWRLARFKGGVELGSPVMIVKQASDAAGFGADMFLRAVVGITIALAFFNLLPFPALDGGRLFFVAVEAATGRKVNPKLESTLHAMGFLALIALIFVVAAGDVMKLFKSSSSNATNVDAGQPATTTADAGATSTGTMAVTARNGDAGAANATGTASTGTADAGTSTGADAGSEEPDAKDAGELDAG